MPFQTNPITGRQIFVTEDGGFVLGNDGRFIPAEEADIQINPIPQTGKTLPPPTGQVDEIPAPKESSENRTSTPEPFKQNEQLVRDLLQQAFRLSQPEVVNQLEDARLAREQQLATTYGDLARKNNIEMQNIRSWQAIQQAQIQKEAVLAASLASTAYLANTPNANILAGLNAGAQVAANAFKK